MKQNNNFFLSKYFKSYSNLINNIDNQKILQLCKDLNNIKKK